MTIYSFAGDNSYLGELTTIIDERTGYPYYVHDVIIEGQILPAGSLVYVKDRYLGDWHLARFDHFSDEGCATLVDDSENYHSTAWRYMLFPDAIITDIDKIPAANILEAKSEI